MSKDASGNSSQYLIYDDIPLDDKRELQLRVPRVSGYGLPVERLVLDFANPINRQTFQDVRRLLTTLPPDSPHLRTLYHALSITRIDGGSATDPERVDAKNFVHRIRRRMRQSILINAPVDNTKP